MSPRRSIETIRPASFVRRSHWYWRLVRDLQTKDWGYRKPRTAQQWLDGARELEQLADEAERIARERAASTVFLPCGCKQGYERCFDCRPGAQPQAPASDQGTIPTGRGYPTTPEVR